MFEQSFLYISIEILAHKSNQGFPTQIKAIFSNRSELFEN